MSQTFIQARAGEHKQRLRNQEDSGTGFHCSNSDRVMQLDKLVRHDPNTFLVGSLGLDTYVVTFFDFWP